MGLTWAMPRSLARRWWWRRREQRAECQGANAMECCLALLPGVAFSYLLDGFTGIMSGDQSVLQMVALVGCW